VVNLIDLNGEKRVKAVLGQMCVVHYKEIGWIHYRVLVEVDPIIHHCHALGALVCALVGSGNVSARALHQHSRYAQFRCLGDHLAGQGFVGRQDRDLPSIASPVLSDQESDQSLSSAGRQLDPDAPGEAR
jgi:hypothetical protein